MSPPAYGIIGEFLSADLLLAAARAAREAGYRRIEAFAPFPLADVCSVLHYRTSIVSLVAATAAFAGGGLTYLSEFWMNAIDYPLNVGGRPLHSWPAFIPATIIVSALWLAAAAFITMLFQCRLPRLNHPLFNAPRFERASADRFFLCVRSDDPTYEPHDVATFLRRQGAVAVEQVEGSG